MTTLTIDIGNTSIKYAVFENQTIKMHNHMMDYDFMKLKQEVKQYSPIHTIISTVKQLDDSQHEALKSLTSHTLMLTHNTSIPIINCYKTPQTLGMDRLAAAVGAYEAVKHEVLIIDIGTAITYDFVNHEGHFLGGNIAPGVQMRLQALHHYTSQLPLVKAEGRYPQLGEDTETAIRSGVLNGIRYEIEGYIHQFILKYHNLSVFLTGGDELYFEDEIKKCIFADNLLVLKGLNVILRHNLTKQT